MADGCHLKKQQESPYLSNSFTDWHKFGKVTCPAYDAAFCQKLKFFDHLFKTAYFSTVTPGLQVKQDCSKLIQLQYFSKIINNIN